MTPLRISACFLLLISCVSALACERPQTVPNDAAAIALAEKKLASVYGEKHIESERPFSAKLERGVRHVWGHLPPEMVGGVAEIWIKQSNGRTIRLHHGK